MAVCANAVLPMNGLRSSKHRRNRFYFEKTMATKNDKERNSANDAPMAEGLFVIAGQVEVQGKDADSGELPLRAFAFDTANNVIGTGDVDENGSFNVGLDIKEAQDVTVIIGPAVDDVALLKDAEAPPLRFGKEDWVKTELGLRLKAQAVLPKRIWWPWRPIRVCVRGRVRKAQDHRAPCPVPFVKVEVYDVDREGCLWPILEPRLPHLVDKAVIRLPELVQLDPIPKPPPIPDPIGPIARMGDALGNVGGRFEQVALNPQPLPPRQVSEKAVSVQTQVQVGEMKALSIDLATRLQDLTVTSRLAPWLVWPHCFYSKVLTCTTNTDCDGEFRCSFWWWPFHVRNGRLRFDARPDIVIKVTQVINGVSRVIYLDPYTSTRWDSWGAYVDLVLDDEDIFCGSGCTLTPTGTTTFFVRVGNDEVYKIRQNDGLYDDTRLGLSGVTSNMAYGTGLTLHALFGNALSSGGTPFFYRLSIQDRVHGGGFKDIKSELVDTRVNRSTLLSDNYRLGPNTVNGVPNLYEVRNISDFFWYNQDWVGNWYTDSAADLETYVPDQGLYTLRLEVFDQNGVKLTSASVDYRDGTAIPPTLLPATVDECDLVLQIDNNAPVISLEFPFVVNDCGVVQFANTPFNFTAHVDQAHSRLNSWGLSYVRGVRGGGGALASNASNSGLATPVSAIASSAPMTTGLGGTCAFALTLDAWAHIRNGFGRVYHTSQSYALAIEKCA